jgi:ATP-binding cassette, subfamily B, bacterial PglK
MIDTLRKAAEIFGRRYVRRWIALLFLSAGMSVFEMVGAVLVYVLVSLVSTPATPIDIPVVGDPRQFVSDVDDRSFLIGLAAAMAAFFLVRAVIRIGMAYVQARVAQNAGARLSTRLATGYLQLPYSFHLGRNSAELIRNSHQAVSQLVHHVFLPAIRIGGETLVALGFFVVMVSVAPTATGVAVLVIGCAALILLVVIQPQLKRLGRVVHTNNRETLGLLQQALHGIRDVKLLGRERWFGQVYSAARLRVARASYLRGVIGELPRAVIELAVIGSILAMFLAALLMGESTGPTLSVLGLFAYAGFRLQPSIQRIIGGLNDLKYSAAPLDDIHADLLLIAQHQTSKRVVDPLPLEHAIVLDNVGFQYPGTDTHALSGINLTVRRGEEIGICGPTGGGKTTLVDLIAGLLEPISGRVLIDGRDLRECTREWQRNLGVVSQSVFLLDDTLRRNIALGVEDVDVDEAALHEAVELAQLREFVSSLLDGLDTTVGERGVRVSGGQRQRIAIARALYHRPDVLIFDEGTAALDMTTEAELMSAMDRLRGNRTIILVAHRLSTVRGCDRVLFIESGRLTATGTYDELVSNHRPFRTMAGSP